jgi:hypothetical protein
MTTAKQYERLPKWAQQRFSSLESEVASLREQLRLAYGGAATSRVWVDDFRHDRDTRLHLPDRARVVFGADPQQGAPSGVTVRTLDDAHVDEPTIEIMGGRSIKVLPRAGNVVWIEPVRW